MTIHVVSPKIQRRLSRIARVLDRCQRWQRLAFMDEAEADSILREHEANQDDKDASMDDGSYPAGPRNDKNKSRYLIQPGHGQHLSDTLRSTAEVRSMRRIADLVEGMPSADEFYENIVHFWPEFQKFGKISMPTDGRNRGVTLDFYVGKYLEKQGHKLDFAVPGVQQWYHKYVDAITKKMPEISAFAEKFRLKPVGLAFQPPGFRWQENQTPDVLTFSANLVKAQGLKNTAGSKFAGQDEDEDTFHCGNCNLQRPVSEKSPSDPHTCRDCEEDPDLELMS